MVRDRPARLATVRQNDHPGRDTGRPARRIHVTRTTRNTQMAAPPDFDAIIAKHGGESAEARAEYEAAVAAWRIERRRQIEEMNALDTEEAKRRGTVRGISTVSK